MKNFNYILIISLLFPLLATSQIEGIDYEWEEQKNKKGISISTSSVEGSSFKAVRGEMVVTASVASLKGKVSKVGRGLYDVQAPYGYSGRTITEDALKAKHTFNRLHPEMQRRFLGLSKALAAKGVPLGVGTGWRVQPTGKRGFASPGNSWHEGVPVEAQANALAIDAVPSSSFNAMEMELPI